MSRVTIRTVRKTGLEELLQLEGVDSPSLVTELEEETLVLLVACTQSQPNNIGTLSQKQLNRVLARRPCDGEYLVGQRFFFENWSLHFKKISIEFLTSLDEMRPEGEDAKNRKIKKKLKYLTLFYHFVTVKKVFSYWSCLVSAPVQM